MKWIKKFESFRISEALNLKKTFWQQFEGKSSIPGDKIDLVLLTPEEWDVRIETDELQGSGTFDSFGFTKLQMKENFMAYRITDNCITNLLEKYFTKCRQNYIDALERGYVSSKKSNEISDDDHMKNLMRRDLSNILVYLEPGDRPGVYKKDKGEKNKPCFPYGISKELKGIGLGYSLFYWFNKKVGWTRLNTTASEAISRVWAKLANSEDFYSVILDKYIIIFDKNISMYNIGGGLTESERSAEKGTIEEVLKWIFENDTMTTKIQEIRIHLSDNLKSFKPDLAKNLETMVLKSGKRVFNEEGEVNAEGEIINKQKEYKKILAKDLIAVEDLKSRGINIGQFYSELQKRIDGKKKEEAEKTAIEYLSEFGK